MKAPPPQAMVDPAQVVADEFLAAFRKRDWGAVFDLAAIAEIEENRISKGSYVGILNAVTADVEDIFTGAKCIPMSSNRVNWRYFLIGNGAKSRAEDLNGRAPGCLLSLTYEGERWRALVIPLIGSINLYTPGAPKERWTKLSRAMSANGVKRIVMVDANSQISAKSLMEAAQGKLSPEQITMGYTRDSDAGG